MPSLGALLSLRDKNKTFTLQAIVQLERTQFNIVKQLANAYERTLSKQIHEVLEKKNQSSKKEDKSLSFDIQANTSTDTRSSSNLISNTSYNAALTNQTNNKKIASLIQESKIVSTTSSVIQS